jgi:hypothetical protein
MHLDNILYISKIYDLFSGCGRPEIEGDCTIVHYFAQYCFSPGSEVPGGNGGERHLPERGKGWWRTPANTECDNAGEGISGVVYYIVTSNPSEFSSIASTRDRVFFQ